MSSQRFSFPFAPFPFSFSSSGAGKTSFSLQSLIPYFTPLFSASPPTLLVFLSHSQTTEHNRRLILKRAQEWKIQSYIYEGGLLNPDFLASLELTKQERGQEENSQQLNAMAENDLKNNDNNNNNDNNDDDNNEITGLTLTSIPANVSVDNDNESASDEGGEGEKGEDEELGDDDHCKRFIKKIIHGCERTNNRAAKSAVIGGSDEDIEGSGEEELPYQRHPRRRKWKANLASLNRWSKYFQLKDKPYVKHAGFIASDPRFAKLNGENRTRRMGKVTTTVPRMLGGVLTRAAAKKKEEEEEQNQRKRKESDDESEDVPDGATGPKRRRENVATTPDRNDQEEEKEGEEKEKTNATSIKAASQSSERIKEGRLDGSSSTKKDDDPFTAIAAAEDVSATADVAKQRIKQSLQNEPIKPDSVVFPSGTLFLVDDFQVKRKKKRLFSALSTLWTTLWTTLWATLWATTL